MPRMKEEGRRKTEDGRRKTEEERRNWEHPILANISLQNWDAPKEFPQLAITN
jgi:hypothetical protein